MRLIWTIPLLAAVLLSGCRTNAGKPQSAQPAGGPVPAAKVTRSDRPIYPWSVVPGGIDSPASIEEAVAADPLVAAHYAALRPRAFRAETLAADRQGYVSYRSGDNIYWTRRPVTIRAWETVLTDGAAWIRGRCGNLVAATPQLPVAPAVDPPEPEMDRPVPADELEKATPPPAPAQISLAPDTNPRIFAAKPEPASNLPLPPSDDVLPAPVFGGSASSPTFAGLVGTSPGTTPAASPGNPAAPLPPAPPPVVPPIEIPPPLLIAVLTTTPPEAPVYPPYTVTHWSTPPPVLYYPPIHPPPPSTPPDIWFPPPQHPPQTTPPYTPPPSKPPPGGPPPVSDPPPPFHPPTLEPPPSNPPPPPENPIPEPSAIVFLLIGLAAIGIGAIKRG